MKLSKLKIFMFFGVLLLLLWGLYPRGIFLGYIYEGLAALGQAESHYLAYLEKHPTSKFAILRLTSLYERMGEPRKALPILEGLYRYRPQDEAVARSYLDLLENIGDEAALYQARRQVAQNLMALRRPPYRTITELLDDAYQYAAWHQLTDDQYEILADLVREARNKSDYAWVLRHLDFNLKKTDKVVAALQEILKDNPTDEDALNDLIGIYIVTGRLDEADALVTQGLALRPRDVSLWQARLKIDEKRGDMTRFIRDAQSLLALHILGDEEEWSLRTGLAHAYLATRQSSMALALYREILAHDDSDPENWLNVIFALESMSRWTEVVTLLKDYLAAFPEDAERQKMLAEVYLYRLKDLSQRPLYRQTILNFKKPGFALDVGNALAAAHREPAAIAWLEDMHALFPQDAEMVELLAQLSLAQKNLPAAKSWFTTLAQMRPADMGTQLMVARELIYMDDLAAAEPYLQTVIENDPQNAEAWYWRSEVHAAAASSPGFAGTRSKLAEFAESDRSAREAIRLWKVSTALTPNESRLLRLAELRLSLSERRWEDAIAILEPMVAEDPCQVPALPGREANTECLRSQIDIGLRRDLGEAYANADQRWKAIPELEIVQAANPNDKFVAEALRDLHKEYDTRVTPDFNFTKYGSEYFTTWGLHFKDYLTPNWELRADTAVGRYVSPSVSFTGWVETGKVAVISHYFRPWHLGLALEGAGSSTRTTATPSLLLEYGPNRETRLALTGTYRELRRDFPQAVAFGTLRDTAVLEGRTTLFNRLVLAATYTAERDYLPSGATAKGNSVEPSAAIILFHKPYVTLGWQMDYTRLNSNGNFLNSVPLIPYQNSQYVTGLISGRPLRTLLLEAGFYNGHDFDRGLSILGGDLWGLRGMVEWAANSWLDVFGSYEFGRQRLLDIPGYSNVATVGVSGHW